MHVCVCMPGHGMCMCMCMYEKFGEYVYDIITLLCSKFLVRVHVCLTIGIGLEQLCSLLACVCVCHVCVCVLVLEG